MRAVIYKHFGNSSLSLDNPQKPDTSDREVLVKDSASTVTPSIKGHKTGIVITP